MKVILSMILGNEERVIERCLDAALPFVDGFALSLNGKDGTSQAIARMACKHGVSGVTKDEPWQSFGHNRTHAFREARRWAREEGWNLASTYMLTIDADMVLRVSDARYRERLAAPSYTLRQHLGASHHDNVRLMRLDHDWRCARRTHEFWAPYPEAPWARLFEGVDIDDRNDGGEHGRKYSRDVELLTLDFQELHDDRSAFYLGETYYHWAQQAEEQEAKDLALERFQLARQWYGTRIDIGGWNEETFVAKYKQAHAVLALERLSGHHERSGIELLLAAAEDRAGRAEGWAALSRSFRDRGWNHAALLCAERARATPRTEDMLFVDESAWTTKPDEDIAVSAFYAGDLEKGREACDRLSMSCGIDQGFVARTMGFYTAPAVEAKERGQFEISPEHLEGGRFAPSTPCIVEAEGREIVNVRLVNYSQERGRWYVSRDQDGAIRTRNVTMSVGLPDVAQRYTLPEGWKEDPRIKGLEDQRWIHHEGRIWLTATTYESPLSKDSPQVVLCRLAEDLDSMRAADAFDRMLALRWGGATAVEKNWLPWSLNGKLHLVYSYAPFVVLGVDEETGECWEVFRRQGPPCASRWRGSGTPIPWRGAHLLVVHEVVHHENHNVYFHRFVRVTGAGIERWSRPFTFDHHGIEYAGGLLARKKEVVVTYSHEDREARWIAFTAEQVERMLCLKTQ